MMNNYNDGGNYAFHDNGIHMMYVMLTMLTMMIYISNIMMPLIVMRDDDDDICF